MPPVRRIDVAAAGLLTLTALGEALWGLTVEPSPWYVAVTVPFATLPIAWRSRRPVIALMVTLLVLVVQTALGSDIAGGFSEPLALLLVLYSVGSLVALRESAAAALVALLAMSAVVALGEGAHLGNFVYVWTLVLFGWVAGRGVRLATERSGLLAERRAVQERSRIARELHDVVSHSVTAIVVQAAAERRELPADTPAARTLLDIEEHGRQTLTELRRLLGLLRVDGSVEAEPLEPQPGLGDVPRLVDASGVAATLTTHGRPVEVSPGLELTIYRVIQEALTNVRKHAAAPAAEVAIRWCADEQVEVEVVSSGGPPRVGGGLPGTGYGLQAMADRVGAYGGRVTAGPTRDGFRLHVTMPVGTQA